MTSGFRASGFRCPRLHWKGLVPRFMQKFFGKVDVSEIQIVMQHYKPKPEIKPNPRTSDLNCHNGDTVVACNRQNRIIFPSCPFGFSILHGAHPL